MVKNQLLWMKKILFPGIEKIQFPGIEKIQEKIQFPRMQFPEKIQFPGMQFPREDSVLQDRVPQKCGESKGAMASQKGDHLLCG